MPGSQWVLNGSACCREDMPCSVELCTGSGVRCKEEAEQAALNGGIMKSGILGEKQHLQGN